VAIRNTRLEELSFKDPESKRHTRFAEPLSLVLISEDLMPATDLALHVAKRLGRNAIEVA
jgi:hypothetical protein